MNEAELNHFDSIVGKQAKIAELQARVEAEKVRVIATQALEAQPQQHYETFFDIANGIEGYADELKAIAETPND